MKELQQGVMPIELSRAQKEALWNTYDADGVSLETYYQRGQGCRWLGQTLTCSPLARVSCAES